MPRRTALEVHPATTERWADLERLFGPRGAYANCWCAFWRIPRAAFDGSPAARKRALLRDAVKAGDVPGLLAYRDGEPVGWVAVQPRSAYPTLLRSPRGKAVPGDGGVWSITCFFVRKEHRRTGVMAALLEAAAAHARKGGAEVLEGYPSPTPRAALSGSTGYMGLVPAFERAGFREVARPTRGSRVMRRGLA